MRRVIRVILLFLLFSIVLNCTSEERPTIIEPEEPKQMCVVDIIMIDSNPPYWIEMSDIYVSPTPPDTGAYYLGLPWWIRRLPDEYRTSFMIEEGKTFFIAARNYYGYNIYPYGSTGANLLQNSDWNVQNPSDTTNGLEVASKTRFYSGFWRVTEFDAFGRPLWKEYGNDHIWRIKDVKNGLANVNYFSQQKAVYFLESSYEVKSLMCVRDGVTKITSSAGVMFRRIDSQEPLGVLSNPVKVPNITVKTRVYKSAEEARTALLVLMKDQ
mgnify:FL=1